MIDYPTLTEILTIHETLIDRYGGIKGVRDMGALESALYRPQTGYYDSIISQAAALMESLVMNHPFLDGNKRIAFAAVDVFLRINGFYIKADPLDISHRILSLLESSQFTHASLLLLLKSITFSAPILG